MGTRAGAQDALPGCAEGRAAGGDFHKYEDRELVSGALNTTSNKAIGVAIPDFQHVKADEARPFPAHRVIVLQIAASTFFNQTGIPSPIIRAVRRQDDKTWTGSGPGRWML